MGTSASRNCSSWCLPVSDPRSEKCTLPSDSLRARCFAEYFLGVYCLTHASAIAEHIEVRQVTAAANEVAHREWLESVLPSLQRRLSNLVVQYADSCSAPIMGGLHLAYQQFTVKTCAELNAWIASVHAAEFIRDHYAVLQNSRGYLQWLQTGHRGGCGCADLGALEWHVAHKGSASRHSRLDALRYVNEMPPAMT